MSRKKNCFAFVALVSVGVVGWGCGTQPSVPVGVQPPTGTQTASQSYPPAAGADSAATSDGSVGSQPTVQLTAARVARDDADWSRFRGPDGMGASDSAKPPVEWSTTENVAWKTKLPGPGASSPIVFGDRIYLTCYTGYFVPDEPGGSLEQLRRHLIALRLSDGEIIWDKAIAAKLPEEERIRDHGFAANSAAADSERVYAFFGKTGVFAFAHDGQQLWQTDVGDQTHGWGTSASPVLYKDLVLINASVESESLYALDRATGEIRWRAEGIREAWNTPVVVTAESGREEVIVATQGTVKAFAPTTGDPLWTCKTDIGWYMVPSVVAHDGIVYCLGGRSGVAALAVRAGGSGDVTATHRLWTSTKGSNVSSPIYLDGYLYWAHEQRGVAYCAVAETGEVVYEQRLERAGQVYASALLANGRLYYLTREGKTFVLAAKPEFEQLAVNDLNDRSTFNGSPVPAGNRLLIRSDKYLYCLGE
ncbi:MAG: PQQ-binding-like beta-propeller repeat protein [Planctomycetales bacterium]|nr:PQQ-binding-like beta-propeller repeat protein [Planctomycetales bacterium]